MVVVILYMSMGWNGRESLPGKDHPDLVSTLVSVQTLKGEAEQLEALNRLPEAKKAMMEGNSHSGSYGMESPLV